MSEDFAERCKVVRADLITTAEKNGISNDSIGGVIHAQAEFVDLLPHAIREIRQGPLDGTTTAKALRAAAENAFKQVAWAEVRKWTAVMVVGGISLVVTSGGAGYLIGRATVKQDVAVLNQTLALNGDEARELARLIEANRGNMGASIRSARKSRDSAGREIVQPLFWAPGQTGAPAAR